MSALMLLGAGARARLVAAGTAVALHRGGLTTCTDLIATLDRALESAGDVPVAMRDVRIAALAVVAAWIEADEWQHQRFGWLEGVRRDASLSAQAQILAHVFVLDFANKHTVQCDPSLPLLESVTGRSRSTLKRAIGELVEAGWMTRITGRGRGRASGYGFLTRAKVVRLKGVKSDPLKGSRPEPLSGSQKGSDLTRKGVKSGPAYIIDKPCKNHGASGPASGLSENPMVIRDAERAVARFRDGRADALAELSEAQPWVLNHILAAELLTPEERQRAGLDGNVDC